MKKLTMFKFVNACLVLALLACGKEDKTPEKNETETDPINTFFKSEIRPDKTKPCFNGAYYRKMVSSKDVWLGIGGRVTLPKITFDPTRNNPAKPGQYLDNPSVYMGGSMGGQETDIGLTWEVVIENGAVSTERKAFRPFLRRTSHSGGQAAAYENAPAQPAYYWYPEEEVTMSVEIVANGKLKFTVEGAGKKFEKEFDADGYRPGSIGEFKRVNAIDQVSNEGKPAQVTKAKVENSKWLETYLLRSYEGKTIKVPAHSGRLTDMRCPATNYFSIIASEAELLKGGETVNINGNGY
ncbi:hypothetical protein [Nubsella zeaxanthinifaciens]|uniref:hypothetical protein n=1 Tax=Nubsella zeaxanthinifaciens TaxID=392412 RepID=UPI0018E54C08|nr:hypothetical protein [Nubsella zeaxanthinifaciens]